MATRVLTLTETQLTALAEFLDVLNGTQNTGYVIGEFEFQPLGGELSVPVTYGHARREYVLNARGDERRPAP